MPLGKVQPEEEQERTLRITIHESPETLRLQIEGRVTGPWVSEFNRTWQALAPTIDSRKFVVDLCGVIHMDADARRLLSEIYKQTGAELLADSPMTQYFADEARQAEKF